MQKLATYMNNNQLVNITNKKIHFIIVTTKDKIHRNKQEMFKTYMK